LGSTRAQTDGSGTVTGTADYAVFGAARTTTGQSSAFGYTGEQHDPSTGLTYLRARSYDPGTGRFLSADTVQPNAPGTQGYNRYAYTANNPTTWTDPSGHAVSDATTVAQHQINTLRNLLIATAAVCLGGLMIALALGPAGMAIGMVCGMRMLVIGLALIMVISIVLQLMLDGWLYFPDGSVPSSPPIILQPEAIAGAAQTFPNSPQDCVGGAISGITDELVWSILLGPAGPVDLAMAAFIGCMTGGDGDGPRKGPPPRNYKLPEGEYEVLPYNRATSKTQGYNGKIAAHHLVEERHQHAWGVPKKRINETPSIVLKRDIHIALSTTLNAVPTGASREIVDEAYRRAYPPELYEEARKWIWQ
jgi:RHS repeat-associated protein